MKKTLTRLKRKTKINLFRALKISGAMILSSTKYYVDNVPSPRFWNKNF
jgi:hypothetical protein